jgi:deoxyribodipyrimidine photo-lyase
VATTRVEPERVRLLADRDANERGRYVLYWMQASQRAEHNPALEVAVRRANHHRVPLVVAAVVVPAYPDGGARHFAFLLGGLGRALGAVARRGAHPCLRVGDPVTTVADLARDACELVVDRGYLRHQRRWYRDLVDAADVPVTQVEGDVVVPIDLVSDRVETAARTIRPRILEHRDRFLVDLATTPLEATITSPADAPPGTTPDVDHRSLLEPGSVAEILATHGLDGGPPPVERPTPGTPAARSALADVLDHVDEYDERRNRYADPSGTSGLSPHLHHGQISPVAVARAALDRAGERAEAFLEELVVRRELAVNFVARHPDHDRFAGLPDWARQTLRDHRDDERPNVFTAAELEAGETDDPVWNAIMGEIRRHGRVHNQLRMYWGKQIVRWTNSPEHAHRTLLELNNRWFLDGRDPSSYANVGWCFGLHDRPFRERPIAGTVRPFTTAALRRKDDLDAWLAQVD